MAAIKPLIAGNWKMNGLQASLAEIEAVRDGVSAHNLNHVVDVLFCLPTTLLAQATHMIKGTIQFGGQDCHAKISGAHTGDISAAMLVDVGATAVIVGHSERRADHNERSQDVLQKTKAAQSAGLTSIICIGETAGERAMNITEAVLKRQLCESVPKDATPENTIIAYEPVWAIGTGLTPTPEDVAQTHGFLREVLEMHLGLDVAQKIKLLYGGSVKPGNANSLMHLNNVNGALVGGASLKAQDFLGILAAFKQ